MSRLDVHAKEEGGGLATHQIMTLIKRTPPLRVKVTIRTFTAHGPQQSGGMYLKRWVYADCVLCGLSTRLRARKITDGILCKLNPARRNERIEKPNNGSNKTIFITQQKVTISTFTARGPQQRRAAIT